MLAVGPWITHSTFPTLHFFLIYKMEIMKVRSHETVWKINIRAVGLAWQAWGAPGALWQASPSAFCWGPLFLHHMEL